MTVKPTITTKAAAATYIRERRAELEALQARYEACLPKILHQQEFLNNRWDLVTAHRQQEIRIGALTDKHNIPIAAKVLESHIKATAKEIATAHKHLAKIESYVHQHAARDQKLIKAAVARAEALHQNFRQQWEPAVATALAQKNWSRAAETLLNLPDYDDFVRIPCEGKKLHSAESERLEGLLYDITRWAETTQAQLPLAARQTAEIKFAETQAEQLREKLVTAVKNFDTWLEKTATGPDNVDSGAEDSKEINRKIKAITEINTTRCGWRRRAKTLRAEQVNADARPGNER